jgi:hypothetical protein
MLANATLPDDAVLKRLQGLLNLAAKNSSPEEAASAAAKAQELLARYNLDVATVEGARPEDGKREEARVDGGTYAWQRELWAAVARLNFCVHWVQVYEVYDKRRIMVDRYGDGRRHLDPGVVLKKRHVLVGRVVNTRATVALAGYLQQAIERALVERLHGDKNEVQQQRFSRWAVSFRRGAARRILEKLDDRRRELETAEAARLRRAAALAERAGTSTATAVTLASVKASEHAANYDFMYGEGQWAQVMARRETAARERRERDEAHARWATDHPEEARAQAAADRKRSERASRRGSSRSERARSPDYDVGAFWDGYDEAADIGLDQQVDGVRTAGALT